MSSIAQISTPQHTLTYKAPESTMSRTVKHAAIGGVIGAALGAGLSFTALPFIGALSAPLAAAIGGAAGIVVGAIVGLVRSRTSVTQAAGGVGQLPLPPAKGTSGTGAVPPPLPR
ncbi:MAG: hypothetical protein JWO69_974 [Thermoleophilia bacterium]|jgi:hypothetical protein|nr:hypothetical protein [Thermoleophilia bacterium]